MGIHEFIGSFGDSTGFFQFLVLLLFVFVVLFILVVFFGLVAKQKSYQRSKLQSLREDSDAPTIKHGRKSKRDSVSREILFQLLLITLRFVVFILPAIFILFLAIGIPAQKVLTGSATEQALLYQQREEQIYFDLENNMDDVNDIYTEERLRFLLTTNDIYVYTNSLWDYSLTVNGTKVDNDEISIASDNVDIKIILTESFTPKPLPDSILRYGSLARGDSNDSPLRHISVKNIAFETEVNSSENITNYILSIKKDDLPESEQFIIEISDQLSAKLNIPFEFITVNR